MVSSLCRGVTFGNAAKNPVEGYASGCSHSPLGAIHARPAASRPDFGPATCIVMKTRNSGPFAHDDARLVCEPHIYSANQATTFCCRILGQFSCSWACSWACTSCTRCRRFSERFCIGQRSRHVVASLEATPMASNHPQNT
jgi:hypothetical protein